MQKQERLFTLAEVHTKVGTMREITLDEPFLQVLGVKTGDFISFSIDAEGVVTVKGRRNTQAGSSQPLQPGALRPGEVTQAALFADAPAPPTKHRNPPMRR